MHKSNKPVILILLLLSFLSVGVCFDLLTGNNLHLVTNSNIANISHEIVSSDNNESITKEDLIQYTSVKLHQLFQDNLLIKYQGIASLLVLNMLLLLFSFIWLFKANSEVDTTSERKESEIENAEDGGFSDTNQELKNATIHQVVTSIQDSVDKMRSHLNQIELKPSNPQIKTYLNTFDRMIQLYSEVVVAEKAMTQALDLANNLRIKFANLEGEWEKSLTFSNSIQNDWSYFAHSLIHFNTQNQDMTKTMERLLSSATDSKDKIKEIATAVKLEQNKTELIDNKYSAIFEHFKNGDKLLGKIDSDINQCKEEVDAASSLIQLLSQRAEEIVNIIDVIDDIAEQTNLLALNASIEAARAGEQGQGFAVVAEEVRKLAARSSSATHSITELLMTIQAEAEQASVRLVKSNNTVGVTHDDVSDFVLIYKNMMLESRSGHAALQELTQNSQSIHTITNELQETENEITKQLGKIHREQNDLTESLNKILLQTNQLTIHQDSLSRGLVRDSIQITHCGKILEAVEQIQKESGTHIHRILNHSVALKSSLEKISIPSLGFAKQSDIKDIYRSLHLLKENSNQLQTLQTEENDLEEPLLKVG